MGVERIVEYHRRFRRLGLSGKSAISASLSGHSRMLLAGSVLDAVPSHLLRDADVVVDVGANQGLWSEAVSKFVHPRRLLAFEPSSATFERLSDRLRSLPGATALHLALGDRSGEATLHRFNRSEFDSLHAPATDLASTYQIALVDGETVRIRTLDDVMASEAVEGQISLFKLDVQGGEIPVLKGATEVLKRTKCLIVELLFSPHYVGEAMFDELHRFITDDGRFILHNLTNLSSDGTGALLWADAVYINREL